MRRVLVRLGFVAVCGAAFTAPGSAQFSPGTSRSSALGALRADVLDQGKVVISAAAGGDLAGLVTLTLYPADSGSYIGEWAFVVAHADNTDPETGVEPEAHGEEDHDHPGADDPPHKDFLRLVHRGALAGAVSSASVTLDADGHLSALSANLAVDRGTQEFLGAAGSGRASLTDLSLTF